MIRIKPKSSGNKKLKKQEKQKSSKNEVVVKKSKAVKHGLRSTGANKTIKKKKTSGNKLARTNKEMPIKKIKYVLAKLNESEEPKDMPFPCTIDLQKHIKLAPKNDSKISLSKDSIEMIKQSDIGMFTSISSVLDTGDKELGIDEMLQKKQQKPKLYSGLPGWGNWANSRSIHRVPAEKPKIRREEQKRKRAYVAELPSKNMHQVTDVPFPFVSVADYESSIRANFSQEFNSRRVHQILSKSKKKVEMELDEQ